MSTTGTRPRIIIASAALLAAGAVVAAANVALGHPDGAVPTPAPTTPAAAPAPAPAAPAPAPAAPATQTAVLREQPPSPAAKKDPAPAPAQDKKNDGVFTLDELRSAKLPALCGTGGGKMTDGYLEAHQRRMTVDLALDHLPDGTLDPATVVPYELGDRGTGQVAAVSCYIGNQHIGEHIVAWDGAGKIIGSVELVGWNPDAPDKVSSLTVKGTDITVEYTEIARDEWPQFGDTTDHRVVVEKAGDGLVIDESTHVWNDPLNLGMTFAEAVRTGDRAREAALGTADVSARLDQPLTNGPTLRELITAADGGQLQWCDEQATPEGLADGTRTWRCWEQIGTDGMGPIYSIDIRRAGFLDWRVVAVDYTEPDWGADGCVDPEGGC